ncbi:auxin-responsive protein SAUR71-like [Vitis riparia]|uniref:auxin-responsive protein SAUR71-like n=1 Tax=Vitis riparia TaxID=96939 RepID=UPI00155A77CE|nr:auxin-responsive protein SAUR71-like [Vitis riparia]
MYLPMRECRNRRLIVRIRRVVKQQLWRIRYLLRWEGEDMDCNSISSVAEGENVMIKGYFSVLAMGNGEPKKFLVALNYLAYPPFVKLLEAAEQEFGFDQQGVLAVPCEANKSETMFASGVQLQFNQQRQQYQQ